MGDIYVYKTNGGSDGSCTDPWPALARSLIPQVPHDPAQGQGGRRRAAAEQEVEGQGG